MHNILQLNYAQLRNNFLERWCPESILRPTLTPYFPWVPKIWWPCFVSLLKEYIGRTEKNVGNVWMSIGFAGRTVWTNRVSGSEVDANLWYHWVSSTKDLHRSERVRMKITNCFPLRGKSGFGGVGCHLCILVKKYCLSERKKSSSREIFGDFK